MNNFNKPQILFCQYCGKECKNLNSLKQHECRCKENPNRINLKHKHKNTCHPKTLGFKYIHNDDKQLFLPEEKCKEYILLGWKYGMNNKSKENISKSLIGKSKGIASTPEKEKERREKISKSMRGNQNWKFNKKHGNSKQGWYKGIYCDSTWELAFLVYYLEHNLYIERCKEKLKFIWNNEEHIYIPDFKTLEGLIEIKGRRNAKSLEKEKQYPNIKVIDKILIKPYLKYVIDKYGIKFWEILYDNKQVEEYYKRQ